MKVDETMVKNFSSLSPDPAPQYAVLRRPLAGGTNDGRRPARYTYWRVGYGSAAGYALPFHVERAGEFHTRPDYLTGNSDHPEATQIYYHVEGEAAFEQPQAVMAVAPGNVLIIPAGQVAQYRAAMGMKYHWLSLGRYWPPEWGLPSTRLFGLRYDVEMEGRFAEIRELLILQKPGFPLRAVSAFYALLARMEELAPPVSFSHSPYPEAVRAAMAYLRDHASAPYDATALAAAANLSQSHLRALFERWVGESPRRFHTRGRIELAARLLREGAMPVSAAAAHAGYADVRHFARVFKRLTGVRPREWASSSRDSSSEFM